MNKIAIIDDHLVAREGIASLIKNLIPNCEIQQYKSGEEFIFHLKLHPKDIPNIAFIDYTMQGLNGIDVSYLLQRDFTSVHKIGISSDSYPEIISQFLKAGCKAFLSKGTSPVEIIEVIKAMYENKYYYNKYVNAKMAKEIENGEKLGFPLWLSDNQYLFIKLCKTEHTNKSIASILSITEDALHKMQQRLYEKLEVNSKSELLGLAYDNKIILNRHYYY